MNTYLNMTHITWKKILMLDNKIKNKNVNMGTAKLLIKLSGHWSGS